MTANARPTLASEARGTVCLSGQATQPVTLSRRRRVSPAERCFASLSMTEGEGLGMTALGEFRGHNMK